MVVVDLFLGGLGVIDNTMNTDTVKAGYLFLAVGMGQICPRKDPGVSR